ncbi:MAG TPA: N-6 DNA methylase [Vicinamibacterales bacterium]|nr:N-6 DNA methylase [Vicinamibacterales bacterium]
MAPHIRGRLISASFANDLFPSSPLFVSPPRDVRTRFARHAERLEETLGPSSGVRSVTDVAVIPLLEHLGFRVNARHDSGDTTRIHTGVRSRPGPLTIATPWGEPLDRCWRSAVHGAIANDLRWCLCCNGQVLRAVDARRTWSRDYVEFDLVSGLKDQDTQSLLWSLLRADAVSDTSPALEEAVLLSSRHGVDVCKALGAGVLDALALLLATRQTRHASVDASLVFEHSLTVLYRVLFLLFAEARALVPLWHPVYRNRYSLAAIVDELLAGRTYRGLWQALQAISRLAHAGCTAGALKVTAFNGRLFSPSYTSAFDRHPIADTVMRDAVVALSAMPAIAGRARARISYRDLDVEQLGAVYEQVLDYEPAAGPMRLTRTRDVRKSSGAFYTPRAVTAYLVRRTLTPLVRQRSAADILRLRIVDPAMGSGAFLVAACRFLAAAVEDALIAEGRWHAGDVTTADRAALRREIASRCLYGVDINPMAVQLGRLSLWLATLAADKPLSFLDHHLVSGDSLIGASPADVQRRPSRVPGRHERTTRSLPLFDNAGLEPALAEAVRVRTRLALEPDESAAIVRDKERTLNALAAATSPLGRWTRVLDLWCAGWFWDDGRAPDRTTSADLVQRILNNAAALPESVSDPLLVKAGHIAVQHRFLHWPLAFPEVFADGGFDVVLGNPPWDMVRGDSGTGDARVARQRQAHDATAFFREAGIFSVESRAHVNRYQLFVERALQLLRPGGRLGLVLPSGIASDAGSAALRRHLFTHADVDSITGLDNRAGIFPIHRGVRFALLTATNGRPTGQIACRFGLTDVERLEHERGAMLISRPLLERLSGSDDLGVPELASIRDLQIVERITATVPWLGAGTGWNVQFGRELNATDDRAAFIPRGGHIRGRPVLEGKQIGPFRVDLAQSTLVLPVEAVVSRRAPRRMRLAYRDVASATNRLTLIAALVPAHAVTTHTLFCLKTPLPLGHQEVLCGLLNSFVANYLIRLRVNTHVTASLMSRLSVPLVDPERPEFDRLRTLTQTLMRSSDVENAAEYHELQAIAARLYGLSAADFEHVLGTFPLIPENVRASAYERFASRSEEQDRPYRYL